MKQKPGFTLLELLVSVSVLSLLSLVIAQVLFTTVRLNANVERMKEIKQTSSIAMDTLTRMIQNARSIQSCTGVAEPSLSIINPDEGETMFYCGEDNGIFRIASESATLISYLTSGNVTLVDGSGSAGCGIEFTCEMVGTQPTAVTIEFNLRQQNPTTGLFESEMQTFKTTVTVRNR